MPSYVFFSWQRNKWHILVVVTHICRFIRSSETVSLKKEDRQHLDPLFSGVRDTYSGSEHFFKNHLGHTIGDLLKNLENNANMLSWLADSAHGSAAHGLFSCTAGLSQTNILVSEFLPVKDSLMYIYA